MTKKIDKDNDKDEDNDKDKDNDKDILRTPPKRLVTLETFVQSDEKT